MSIRIATLKGSLMRPYPFFVRLLSLMSPGVHTEIWYNEWRFSASRDLIGQDGAFIGCIGVWDFGPGFDVSRWHVVNVPVADIDRAMEFIDRALDARVRYGISICECALPKSLSIEADVDCCRPETWDHVFCSQFALLFLCWCDHHDLLLVPKSSSFLLWSVNSRGCLPSRLQIITDMVFGRSDAGYDGVLA